MLERRAEVLVVDRDPAVGRRLLGHLHGHGYAAEWVDEDEKAFNRLDSHLFDVLVTELNVPRVDGMRLMLVAKERNPEVCVVFIAREPDIALATEAMRQGAYDFQTKPLNLAKLEAVIQRGLAHQRLVYEQVELKRRLDERFGLGSLIGQSRQMVQVYNAVRQIGPTQETVLVFGEPGTGKDLIAQALHNLSPRRDEPFVRFNSAHLSETVIEQELFGGLERGAVRQGRFELADGGTLFLESVDGLTPRVQETLLAVLLQRRIERTGGAKRIPVDVRVIAATNQRLDRLAEAGAFHAGLYQHLAKVSIEAPALRARRDDIPLLVNQALRAAAEKHARPVMGITRHAMNLLLNYDWPGNVRELQNVVEGMVATAHGNEPITPGDIPEYLRRNVAPEAGEIRLPAGASMRDIERIAIEETMSLCGHNKEKCAKTLGIGLRTLYRKLNEYGLR